MLKEISWSSYWTFIALTVAIYYLGLLLVFKIKAGVILPTAVKAVWHMGDQDEHSPKNVTNFNVMDDGEDDFHFPPKGSDEHPIYACIDEVNAYLEEARRSKGNKADTITALGQILSKYPDTKESEHRNTLSNLIRMECAHQCLIDLTEADMERVWQSEMSNRKAGGSTLSDPAP